jgi:YidC/Oxa1 family membrane protein insertase
MHRVFLIKPYSFSALRQTTAVVRQQQMRRISMSVPRLAAADDTPIPTPIPPIASPSPSPTAGDAIVSSPDLTLLTDPTDTATASADLGLSSWHPFDLVSQLVEYVHLTSGLPYWAVIIATTIGVRIACVPLGVKAVQNSARMAAIRPKMNKLIAFSKANPNNTTYQKELFLLWKKNNVNPLKALAVPLFQLPLFVTFFFGIRQMGEYYPGMAEGGIMWFPDLMVHDPMFLLPIINGASFLLMVELNSHDQAVEADQAATFKTAMRALAVFMVPVTMYTPAVSQ